MKVCKVCQQEKALTEFYLIHDKYRAGKCKECQKAYNRSQHVKGREYSKQYRARNPEKRKETTRRWYFNNKDKKHAWTNKRRKRLRQAEPPWFEDDKISTVYDKAQSWGFEVDHIVPITSDVVCGLHCWDNLQLLDKTENLRKRNRVWPGK